MGLTEIAVPAPDTIARYEPVIGLEVHVQLLTASKVFCGCANKFGSEPNTNICPVCLGLPGSLPVLNAKAVEFAVLASLALFIFGGEVIRGFSAAMVFGVVIGTYSSIYISAPALIYLNIRPQATEAVAA